MKDLHNHLLYGIDDGSKNIESSVKLLKRIKRYGVDEIVLTPHYIIGSNYNANNKDKNDLLKTLQKKTSIKLYLGNEVTLDNDIISYIENGEISTINNTRYLLVEFPLNERLDCAESLLDNIIKNDIVPIIAHPERYHYYKLKDLEKFIDMGCLFQGNITSLMNKYGNHAKDNLTLLLKKDMIHVLGTDSHRNILDIRECEGELERLVSKDRFKELTETNFNKIIKNKVIKPYEIKKLRFFDSFKNIK